MPTFKISAICPVYNEEHYVEKVLQFFDSAYPKEKELIIIDGNSTDKTRDVVNDWAKQHPNIYLIDNPKRYVPYALNLAIPLCKGRYIVRLDAHSDYASDYFEKILETFEKTNADIVGGPTRTRSKNDFQQAVSKAICNPFGIGDSKVHQIDYEGLSDSVTFGAWKKEIFSKTGLFDISLKRNQDDEFHYRSKSLGFNVYQHPDIKLYYYPRNTLKGLFKQYFQYGIYKPIVLWKIKSELKLRHLVPSAFSLYFGSLPWLAFLNIIFVFPVILYVFLNIYFSFANNLSLKVKIICLVVYPTLHISYGLGFLIGLIKLPFMVGIKKAQTIKIN